MDKISKLGYSNNSPFRSSPFLDIKTTKGLIDMSNTDMPLLGVDDTGYAKLMMPYSGMHKFRGNKVREMPMQQGGTAFINTGTYSAKVPVYNNQTQIDKEDASLVDFATRHNMINPTSYHSGKKVGDPVIQSIDLSTGLPYDGRYSKIPQTLVRPMPDWVTDIGWDNNWNMPYYKDGNDINYVDKKWYNSPRFLGHQQLGMKRMGGLINNNKKQQGGYMSEVYDYLFGDDEQSNSTPTITAPDFSEQEADIQSQYDDIASQRKQLEDMANDNLSMSIAMRDFYQRKNPYGTKVSPSSLSELGQVQSQDQNVNPYVGTYGQQIISELTKSLGYTPQFNSVYRTPAQQQKLVKQGYGVNNSWHLTGDAVDMKPTDWSKLPDKDKQFFKSNYDVVYHNNHYHIEPKGKR